MVLEISSLIMHPFRSIIICMQMKTVASFPTVSRVVTTIMLSYNTW
jgi:hypothetical protein